jgi:hypothetical protein
MHFLYFVYLVSKIYVHMLLPCVPSLDLSHQPATAILLRRLGAKWSTCVGEPQASIAHVIVIERSPRPTLAVGWTCGTYPVASWWSHSSSLRPACMNFFSLWGKNFVRHDRNDALCDHQPDMCHMFIQRQDQDAGSVLLRGSASWAMQARGSQAQVDRLAPSRWSRMARGWLMAQGQTRYAGQ